MKWVTQFVEQTCSTDYHRVFRCAKEGRNTFKVNIYSKIRCRSARNLCHLRIVVVLPIAQRLMTRWLSLILPQGPARNRTSPPSLDVREYVHTHISHINKLSLTALSTSLKRWWKQSTIHLVSVPFSQNKGQWVILLSIQFHSDIHPKTLFEIWLNA
jgi:hypothetical protein